MAELTFNERVDDAILVAAWRLSGLRNESVRAGLVDFRTSCEANLEDDPEAIWRIRIDRCNALLFREDAELRKLALSALEREK